MKSETTKNKQLFNFRIGTGLSQTEIAKNLGISRVYYIKIEHGTRQASTNFIRKFIKAYPDAPITKLFF